MHTYLISNLDHPAYHVALRLPRYNGKVTVFSATCSTDAAKVLRRANPEWSQEAHRNLALLHAFTAARLQVRHSELLDAAATETFGRPFQVTDYRIAAIGCEEFSEEQKAELRKAAYGRTAHQNCARAHAKASRFQQVT